MLYFFLLRLRNSGPMQERTSRDLRKQGEELSFLLGCNLYRTRDQGRSPLLGIKVSFPIFASSVFVGSD